MTTLPPVASAPTSVMAVQEGLTSIRVSWSPPTPLGDTTGYRIYYSGGSSGSEDVPGQLSVAVTGTTATSISLSPGVFPVAQRWTAMR